MIDGTLFIGILVVGLVIGGLVAGYRVMRQPKVKK